MGDESRLARSFDRIRSIIRKKRKNKGEDGDGTKMEAIVNEVIRRKRTAKLKNVKKQPNANLDVPQTTLYRRSYEVSTHKNIPDCSVIQLGLDTRRVQYIPAYISA